MIYYNSKTQEFHLQTNDSSYIMKVAESGHLIQLYYGAKLTHREDFSSLDQRLNTKLGSTTIYNPSYERLTLETLKLEAPCYGKGDYRDPLLHLKYTDASRTSDFVFKNAQLLCEKPALIDLPSTNHHTTQDKDEPIALRIILQEPVKNIELHLNYAVFEQANVISKNAILVNTGSETVQIQRALSACLDLSHNNLELIHLHGKWIREAQVARQALSPGIFHIDSKKGVSSANHNPFLCLASPDCSESSGECYGFGLLYSGNHQCSVEVSPYDQTRVMLGINSFDFSWELAPNNSFTTPEVVMTYSANGLNTMSQQFHYLVQKHIIAPQWNNYPRPIQVNNWEATYFDFNSKKLMSIAKQAKKLGIELFVLDDGWFGHRDDETSSLGDYFDNKKLRGGVNRLSKKIKSLGLQFGIWVEPEMISIDSKVYKQHPEWAIKHADREASLGRHQLLIDMSNPEVIDYLFTQLSHLFTRANVDYVKWDHNRNFSDIYSSYLSHEEQGGFAHRYVLGLYRLLEKLTTAFPHILFESCSSGGNRFDLGMLSYMPQTWTSDNTDALERLNIQYGTSMLYPPSAMSAHVSAKPSHQVLRHTPIETRFNVAAFGNLGYQLDITQLTHYERKAITQQIAFYKKHRQLLQYGTFYRIQSPFTHNQTMWLVLSEDKSEALLGYYQKIQQSNPSLECPRLPMLDLRKEYLIQNRSQYLNLRNFGSLINESLPIRIKDRGIIHTLLANRYMHCVADEEYRLYGDQLAYNGLPLNTQFTATEMTDNIRYIGDAGSRIYHIQQVPKA